MMSGEMGLNSRLLLGEGKATLTSKHESAKNFLTVCRVRKKVWMII